MSQPPDPSVPPQYPEPSYPEATLPAPPADPPPYPGEPPTRPAGPPAYAGEPRSPEATLPAPPAGPPPYPGEPSTRPAGPPPYPGGTPSPAAAIPTPPTTPPPYPGDPSHVEATIATPPAGPPYPGEPSYPASPPQYPHTAASRLSAPPEYPAAAPTHHVPPPEYPAAAPARQGPPPEYPATVPAAPGRPPVYPGEGPAYQGQGPGLPPQYPPPPQAPAAPPGTPHATATPAPAPAPAPAPETAPAPAPAPEPAPDDLDYRHRGARLHVAEHQRGADATAIGRLAVQLPGALVSLALVSSIALGLFGSAVGTLVVVAWVASGLLVFHRPTELAFARYVLKLRLPTQEERARLEPIWNEVTARAGIEPGTYELMVENSDELNAVAVAGHVVGVTTYSLNRIPTSNLAAVLAHELGHHTGGHAWAGLLGYWYSLPGRIAWAVTRGLARFAIAVAGVFSMAATGFLILFMALVAVAAFFAAWYLTIPLVLAPYLLAYAGRRGELRADQQAAELGFARQLAEVLHHSQAEEAATKAALAATGQKLKEPGALDRLLSSHPDHVTRLNALQPYLGLHR
ncbi:M48 family metalloprotease [Streptomyces sp. NPDC093984]|uniref:M48 family metalloprotease n=1 Tax=Streptomyces sp. NPDC093984 TaxID=3366052 RepID=UPI0038218619